MTDQIEATKGPAMKRLRDRVAYEVETYRTAHENGMSYWRLRRVRRAVRAWVRANVMPFEEWK